MPAVSMETLELCDNEGVGIALEVNIEDDFTVSEFYEFLAAAF